MAVRAPHIGHVRRSRQHPAGILGFKVPPLGGMGRQCFINEPEQGFSLLGQPTLDSHSPVAVQAESCPMDKVPHGSSMVGWKFMLASTSTTARQGDSCGLGAAKVGVVHKLPGREDATHQVAPSLYSVVRLLLERKQVCDQSITLHLKPTPTLVRYDGAFRCFWASAPQRGSDVTALPVPQVASLIVMMADINENRKRHAYSACLLLPGFESLTLSSFGFESLRLSSFLKDVRKGGALMWQKNRNLGMLKKSCPFYFRNVSTGFQ